MSDSGYLYVLGESLVDWLLNKKLFKSSFEDRFEGVSSKAEEMLRALLDDFQKKGKIGFHGSYYRGGDNVPNVERQRVTLMFSDADYGEVMGLANSFVEKWVEDKKL